jgi:hypothetical protein
MGCDWCWLSRQDCPSDPTNHGMFFKKSHEWIMSIPKCYTESSDICLTKVLTAKLAVYRCKSWTFNVFTSQLPLTILCYHFDEEIFVISVVDTSVYNKSPEHQWRLCTIIPAKESGAQHYIISWHWLRTGQWSKAKRYINLVPSKQHICKCSTWCPLSDCVAFSAKLPLNCNRETCSRAYPA